jgi:hypothetical protein
MIWRPKLLWLLPELEEGDRMQWVDLTVGGGFAAAAAWISNAFRGIISVFATALIGTLGFVSVGVGYGIPGMDNFTVDKLATDGLQCNDDDCWAGLVFLIFMAAGGTANQFKMSSLDMTMPPASSYDRWLQKIEGKMELIFKMSEFIENAGNLDTDELMERCMQAREKLVGYATFVTNIMQVRR